MIRQAFLVLALAAGLTAQSVTFANTGGAQRRWADVSIPLEVDQQLGAAATFISSGETPVRAPAYRGARRIGETAQLWHVLMDLEAGQLLTGRLEGILDPGAGEPVLFPDEGEQPAEDAELAEPRGPPQVHPTRSVADDPTELFPRLVVQLEGQTLRPAMRELVLVESGIVRQVWRVRSEPASGFHVEAWLYVYTQQDVVDAEVLVNWSDRSSPLWALPIQGAWIETGEFFAVDYRKRHGWAAPWKDPESGRWVQPIAGPGQVGDGEQFFLSGRLLAASALDLSDVVAVDDQAIRTLVGARSGSVYGVSGDWSRAWGPFDDAPALPATFGAFWPQANARHAGFRAMLENAAGYFVPRPESLAKHTGQTGDQVPFGASKGFWAVNGDPRWIFEARYSETLYFRGFHHRELDGRRLLFADHPTWRTWRMYSDHRNTDDMLGKPDDWRPWGLRHGASGFGGTDEEHRVDTHDGAIALLTGSYSLESALLDAVETDLAEVRGRTGAPRAVGRRLLTWAHYLTVLGPDARAKLQGRASELLSVLDRQWIGSAFVGDPTKTVRVMSTVRDARVLRDPETGDPLLAWSVWEHGLLVRGLRAYELATGDPVAAKLVREISRTIVLHGAQWDGATWRIFDAVEYRGGTGLSTGDYLDGRASRGTLASWILPAIKIGGIVHSGTPVGQRAQRIMRAHRPDGPTTIRDAEHLAVGR